MNETSSAKLKNRRDLPLEAAQERLQEAEARALGDTVGGNFYGAGADEFAAEFRRPVDRLEVAGIGAGGELKLRRSMAGSDSKAVRLVNTVHHPDMVTAAAVCERMRLAERAGCLDTGLDAADTIQAGNSLEKMLAHQLAAAHRAAMMLTGQS